MEKDAPLRKPEESMPRCGAIQTYRVKIPEWLCKHAEETCGISSPLTRLGNAEAVVNTRESVGGSRHVGEVGILPRSPQL